MTTRTSSTVCCRLTARVSSRGAVPNTSALIACGASGWRNHSTKAATPAWATRLTQDRFSGGIARYQGRTSSIRAIAAVASAPMLLSRRRTVAAERVGTSASVVVQEPQPPQAACRGVGRVVYGLRVDPVDALRRTAFLLERRRE